MVDALTIGLTEKEFWACTPHRLQAHLKAYESKENHNDYIAWLLGAYNLRAFSVALDNAFNGRKARSKYFEKPMSQEAKDKEYIDGSNLSEEEKELLRQQFVNNLKAMEESHNNFIRQTTGKEV